MSKDDDCTSDDCLPAIKNEPRAWKLLIALVKSVAASFPGAASLAQAYSEWEAHKLDERINEFQKLVEAEFRYLKTRLTDLETRLNESAQEFPALLEVTIERVRREHNEMKRLWYARLFCGALARGTSMPTEDKIDLIQQLETLNSDDLSLLKLLGDGKARKLEDIKARDLGWSYEGEAFPEAFVASISRIESRGLLIATAASGGGVHYLPGGGDQRPTNWADRLIMRRAWLSSRGKKLIELLRL
jgi:hypothetical protein